MVLGIDQVIESFKDILLIQHLLDLFLGSRVQLSAVHMPVVVFLLCHYFFIIARILYYCLVIFEKRLEDILDDSLLDLLVLQGGQ